MHLPQRYALLALVSLFFGTGVLAEAQAATATLKPDEIKSIFAVGKPFAATPPTGKVVKITLNPDGSAKAVPEGKKTGTKGTWRLSDKGYCTTWGKGNISPAEHSRLPKTRAGREPLAQARR